MGLLSARTVVSALSARSVVGQEYASTVVSAVLARSAVGHKYASTVVSAIDARSAVVHQSASTVVYALIARSAVGHKYASTVVGAICARSAKRARNEATKTRRRNTPSTRVSIRLLRHTALGRHLPRLNLPHEHRICRRGHVPALADVGSRHRQLLPVAVKRQRRD